MIVIRDRDSEESKAAEKTLVAAVRHRGHGCSDGAALIGCTESKAPCVRHRNS